jgi:DNA polymerase-3 subunit gamma/tau
MVAVVNAEGGSTLREQQDLAERSRKDGAAANPAVQAIMAAFPGARVVDVRTRADDAADAAVDAIDPGLAASLEAGEGMMDGADDPYGDMDF